MGSRNSHALRDLEEESSNSFGNVQYQLIFSSKYSSAAEQPADVFAARGTTRAAVFTTNACPCQLPRIVPTCTRFFPRGVKKRRRSKSLYEFEIVIEVAAGGAAEKKAGSQTNNRNGDRHTLPTSKLATSTDEWQNLFAKLEAQGVTGKTDDEELDELMRGAILSLRTCLVELEKLAGLTDSFYCRYLVTMKRAVCQETLIGASVDSDDDMSEPVTPDCENRPKAGLADSVATLTTSHGMLSIPLHITQQSITMIPSSSTAETKTAFPFLHAFGFPRLPRMLPPVIDEAALQRGPRLQSGAVENSEEEKASS
ncbi:unnamed protein product [Caenorhabditis auriculariae]|uniref:MEIS N-terminal domain-containing protein n=1 Tax=Caenorhabditis auriculariae TaxID=2777116 RepID=A0A8S1GPY8_9PELO|nr:unnamed protein product [Caenorhabditis auriculariae]